MNTSICGPLLLPFGPIRIPLGDSWIAKSDVQPCVLHATTTKAGAQQERGNGGRNQYNAKPSPLPESIPTTHIQSLLAGLRISSSPSCSTRFSSSIPALPISFRPTTSEAGLYPPFFASAEAHTHIAPPFPPPQAHGLSKRGAKDLTLLFWSWKTTKLPRVWEIPALRKRRSWRQSPLEKVFDPKTHFYPIVGTCSMAFW
jgi:hypothetical protein